MAKTALIFGAAGQDGRYLSELLISEGYSVIGCGSKGAGLPFDYRVCDIADEAQVERMVSETAPDEAYNLAGVSSPQLCESEPELARAVNAGGAKNVLAALRKHAPSCRLFHASTAYIFAPGPEPKDERSAFGPRGVYGRTKLEAHNAVASAREGGLFAASGILFNHESPLRPPQFVTRKITQAAARFKAGRMQGKLELGGLDSVRDWGFAGDYAEAMWLMLQAGTPKDYVIATGRGHTVRELADAAFSHVGLDYRKCVSVKKGLVAGGPDALVGNPAAIKKDLKWSAKTSFEALVGMMVEADLRKEMA